MGTFTVLCFTSLLVLVNSGEQSNYYCKNDVGDTGFGGACHVTTHTMVNPIESKDITFPDPEIKEWHFHVYWFQTRQESFDAAMRIRQELLEEVGQGNFVVVLNGVTEEMLPGLNESNIPHINTEPIGPHPCGSYEVWAPKEHFAAAMDFFMRRRGDLTILVHALSRHEIEDHFSRNMWLGTPYSIDGTLFTAELPSVPLQYPELGLGYSAKN